MLYLIPAWNRSDGYDSEETPSDSDRTEFDDTIKQMQLFQRNPFVTYCVMLLSYAPGFRHFLHHQGVMRAPYWSVLDAICEIKAKRAGVFSYREINWPEHTEFVDVPTGILAFRNGEKYAKVEFGTDGNTVCITMYEKGETVRKNEYDDRGFVAASVVYEKGKPVYRDFFMENGSRKARLYFSDGRVSINPSYPNYRIHHGDTDQQIPFQKTEYSSINEVICEVMESYLAQTSSADIFCAAWSTGHASLLLPLLRGKKLIISMFGERYRPSESDELKESVTTASRVVVDSASKTELLTGRFPKMAHKIEYISPYDTRRDYGISMQISVQNVLLPVDGLSEKRLSEAIAVLGSYLPQNKKARVCLMTRENDKWNRENLWEIVQEQAGPGLEGYFYTEKCANEPELTQCLRLQRLVVDLRETPDPFLQIVAVSMGIPQIASAKTAFLSNYENGRILRKLRDLPDCLSYYLDSLTNWNAAMVSSEEIVKQYSTEELLKKWKGVLSSFE